MKGPKMAKFTVEVEESLSRLVEVDADSYEEAELKVANMYSNGEIVLDANDYVGVAFINVQEEVRKAALKAIAAGLQL